MKTILINLVGISIKVDGMNEYGQFVTNLKQQKFTLPSRVGFIRTSQHYYNTGEELDTVLKHFL